MVIDRSVYGSFSVSEDRKKGDRIANLCFYIFCCCFDIPDTIVSKNEKISVKNKDFGISGIGPP